MSDVSSGWGRFTWGQAYWNRDALLATGWGAKAWNDGEWGNLADETVSLTGISFSASLGSVDIVSTNIIIPTGISFTANGALIYNSSDSNAAVCAIAFGSDKTATNGTFTIQFPTADATNAIIRLA